MCITSKLQNQNITQICLENYNLIILLKNKQLFLSPQGHCILPLKMRSLAHMNYDIKKGTLTELVLGKYFALLLKW